MPCLLSTTEMSAADRSAMARGISGERLMEAAGWQVATALRKRFKPRLAHVLCGPGNNGGDGFVVARLLEDWGWPVRLYLLGTAEDLRGDASLMARRWRGAIRPLSLACLDNDPLVVDALFGAGLSRPLDGVARQVVEAIAARGLDVVAVDMPSGVDGNSGAILGAAAKARLTVTFFRAKPGHLLLPGRALCGELAIADIGIPDDVLDAIAPRTFRNGPALWRRQIRWPGPESHKYDRGHLLLAGGAVLTGAARLAASAARRAGAGLVTVVAPADVADIFRTDAPGVMVQPCEAWGRLLADPRVTAVVAGPGLGVGPATRALVAQVLAGDRPCVLDADALSSFEGDPGALRRLGGTAVLTPHEGEFRRLFGGAGDRLTRARRAAAASGAVIVLKGSDSVIVAPDGRAAISEGAPPDLATGGTGDVLAGMIGGLLAQGMDPFDAACFGVWLQSRAAEAVGPGLLAEDLAAALPAIWRLLRTDGPQLVAGPAGPGKADAAPRPRFKRRRAAWTTVNWRGW